MFYSRWIYKLLSPRRSRSQRRRQAAQTRKPNGLILEALEDRCLLSADYVTTQVTLQAPFGGASNVTGLVNAGAALGEGLNYTTSGSTVGSVTTATSADLLGTYKLFNGTSATFQSASLVETYALQGVVIPPVGGAAFSTMFTKGVVAIYAVPTGSFNPQDETTWGPNTAGSTLLYSATVAPPNATHQGPLGDPSFNGQSATGQNQASFFVPSGQASLDALVVQTLSNPNLLFAPPQPFNGLQTEISETNALTGTYPSTGFPTNAQLDANFATLAALAPGQGLTGGQFTANSYTQTANVNGPNTLTEISITNYPLLPAPVITTSQQPATATVGSSVADKATVTGLVNANSNDTITFNLYSSATTQNSSTLLFTDTETVSLSGGNTTATATSKSFTTQNANTDFWVATFNGDSSNISVTSGAAAEPVTITPTTPAINTTQLPASATVGSSIADKASVTGLVNANSGDTVTFHLFNNPNGTGPALFTDTETVTLSGGTATATSKSFTTTNTGTDFWVATFNGDSNNGSVTSGTALEPVVISPTTPGINTSQQPASATVGSSIADKATVTGLVNASSTDTVTFNLFNNPNGTGPALFTDTETVSLSGSTATATSKGFTTTATGTDYWVATFNGDSNNGSVTSGTALEPVTITPTTLAINTSQQPASATVGSSIADKATVTGLVNASSSDTVTFNLYSSSTTQNSSTRLFSDTETVTLSGSTATATSKGFTTSATGTDFWVATFNGDSNNSSVTSGAAAEPVTITPTTPAINTSQQPASASVGSPIADKATVTGLVNASSTDTVTFNLFNNPNGTGPALFTDTETVSLSGGTATATSASYLTKATGTDYWVATFNGDSNNGSVTSGAGAEPVTITPAPTTVISGNASINFYGTNPSPAFTFPLAVNSPAGTVTGNVTASLEAGSSLIALTPAGGVTLTNGTVDVSVAAGTLPANLQPGTYEIIETYLGNGQFASSSAIDTLTITIAPTTVVSGNASITFYGTTPSPAFTVPLAVNSPAGTVTGNVTASLEAGSSLIALTPAGGVALTNGTVDVSVAAGALPANLLPGTYEILETYLGNGQFASSSAIDTLTITIFPTSVVPGSVTVNFGSTAPFTLSAEVNSPDLTVNEGNVTFTLEAGGTSTTLGTAAVTQGSATLTVPTGTLPAGLQTGNYEIEEVYADVVGGPFTGSGANGILTVAAAATTVVPGSVTVPFGGSPGFTLSTEVNSPIATVNSGKVTFTLETGTASVALGSASVTSGSAVLTVPAGTLPANLPFGKYDLEEVYADVTGGQFAGSGATGALTVTTTPTPSTSVIPGNAVISTNDPTLIIPVAVNSPNGPVNTGTVTISLVNGNSVIFLGSAPVSNGTANVTVNIPALAAGTYQLIETYTDSTGTFGGSVGIGTLTAQPIPPQVAALELAIDAAALVSLNNPGAIMELQLFAETFLHFQIPLSVPALVGNIQALFPKTDGLGLAAIGAGMFLANDLAIENPI